MTDRESPENLKSLLPPEISQKLLLSSLSDLTACLTEYTEIVEVIPPKIDDILESLKRIEGFADNESSILDKHLENFGLSQDRIELLVNQFTIDISNLYEKFQESNNLVASIQSLKIDQDTTQVECSPWISLLIANIENASSSLQDVQNKVSETIQGFDSKVGRSVGLIQLDVENAFANYASQLQTLKDEWKTLQSQSNQAIEECKQIISDFQGSQASLNKNIFQDNISKNKLQRFIDGLNNSFESRLLLTSIISSIVSAITIFALGLIAIKIFLPQDNNLTIDNNQKNTNVKPTQKQNK